MHKNGISVGCPSFLGLVVGCAGGRVSWVEHLRRNDSVATCSGHPVCSPSKRSAGAAKLASCLTAAFAGYTIDRHEPRQAISKLLAERPAARALAVPANANRLAGQATFSQP